MLQVMSGLERQISDYAAREADIQRRMKENKDELENALTIKDQAIAREEHHRREEDRLIEERKKAAFERQKDIQEAVDSALERAQQQIKTIEKSLEDLTIKNSQLQFSYEIATKEKKHNLDTIEKLQALLEDQRRSDNQAIKLIDDKLVDVSVSKEAEIARRVEVQEINKELRNTIDKIRAQHEHNRVQSEQREKLKDAEIINLKNELAQLSKDITEKTRIFNRKQREFEDISKEFESKIMESERKRSEEITNLTIIKAELESSIREYEYNNQAEIQSSTLTIEQIKEKNNAAVKYLEKKLTQERDLIKQLQEKNRYLIF